MPYRKIARAILSLLLKELEEKPQPKPHGSNYTKQRRHEPKEAPAKKHQHAIHATEEEHRTEEEFQWRQNRNITVLTLIAAAAAIGVSTWTLVETRRQADDSHESLVLSESPFVYGNPPRFDPAKVEQKDVVRVSIPLGNSGNTPTRKLRFQILCEKAGEVTPRSLNGYYDRQITASLSFFGPRAETTPIACDIPRDDWNSMHRKREGFFVYGRAEYYSVIDIHYKHVTQFCYEVEPSDDTTIGGFVFSCPKHNCADEECREQ